MLTTSLCFGAATFIAAWIFAATFAATSVAKFARSNSRNPQILYVADVLENADAWVWDTLDSAREHIFGAAKAE